MNSDQRNAAGEYRFNSFGFRSASYLRRTVVATFEGALTIALVAALSLAVTAAAMRKRKVCSTPSSSRTDRPPTLPFSSIRRATFMAPLDMEEGSNGASPSS